LGALFPIRGVFVRRPKRRRLRSQLCFLQPGGAFALRAESSYLLLGRAEALLAACHARSSSSCAGYASPRRALAFKGGAGRLRPLGLTRRDRSSPGRSDCV